MKFTREHGVVRAKIDCTNPHALPQHVSHFYDGEGFADFEALGGRKFPCKCQLSQGHHSMGAKALI
jgi:hypothetical protein